MKIRVSGDVHGRNVWKKAIEDIDDIDRFIFVGDYCDSYTLDSLTIVQNFLEIIKLKKDYPDKIILLHGNHDMMQYYLKRATCSGFRAEIYPDLYEIFRDNYKLFKTVHYEEGFLFSHAGVTQQWLKQCKIDYTLPIEDIVDTINDFPNHFTGIEYLNQISMLRGGWDGCGSCLWCDESEFYKMGLLPDVIQVFGHTPQPNGIKVETENGDTIYIAVDTLGTTQDFLTIEI